MAVLLVWPSYWFTFELIQSGGRPLYQDQSKSTEDKLNGATSSCEGKKLGTTWYSKKLSWLFCLDAEVFQEDGRTWK